jgi:hypothetical protein
MAEEITLMRNMLVAVVEERYADAGSLRYWPVGIVIDLN